MYHAKHTDSQRLINIPYEAGRQNFHSCDCIGLILLYYDFVLGDPQKVNRKLVKKISKSCQDLTDFQPLWDYLHSIEFEQIDQAEQPGDLLIFKTPRHNLPHFGVFVADEDYFLQIYEGANSSYSHLRGPWSKRFLQRIYRKCQ